jgi:RimJ/RimL family protein N-acetyltransferase
MTSPLAFLMGEDLYLRPLLEEDCNGPYLTWFNDEEVCRGNSHHVFPCTRQELLDYVNKSHTRRDELILAIILKNGDRHIGNIALQTIDPVYRSADLTILIGDKSTWGRGFGTEAAKLLCDHGFNALNLHRIACGTFDTNIAMKKLALDLGMKQEGKRRDAVYKDDRYIDMIEFGVLRREYEKFRMRK